MEFPDAESYLFLCIHNVGQQMALVLVTSLDVGLQSVSLLFQILYASQDSEAGSHDMQKT